MVDSLETLFVEVPEGRIAYDDTGGDGPLVLCAPGMGDIRSQFRLLRPQLVDAGYRVLTMDIRGAGQSSADFDHYTPADVADDMAALLQTFPEAIPAVVVGNSMAAASAIRLAAIFPALVRALVLLGPVPRDHPIGGFRGATFPLLVGGAFTGPWGPGAWAGYYRDLYPSWDTSHQPPDLDAHIAALRANLAEDGRLHALRRFILSSKADCARHIGEVHVPSLVVEGTKDPDVPDPAAEAEWLAEEMGSETLMLEGIGHYPHLEKPDVTGPAVIAFLARLPEATTAATFSVPAMRAMHDLLGG